MSGPVSTQDAPTEAGSGSEVRPPCLEVTDSRETDVGAFELAGCIATVMVGDLAGATSRARHDTDHVGVDFDFPHARSAVVPMEPGYEYAVVVTSGAVSVDDAVIEPGHLAYLGTGRDECRLTVAAPARALLIGGTPFEEPVLMWWNFVARTKDEITRAREDWAAGHQRFGQVDSKLGRMDVGPPPWASA